jgi:hypothetical protein
MQCAYGFMVLSPKCQRGSLLVILFKISSWLFFGDQNFVTSFIHVLASLGGSYNSFME